MKHILALLVLLVAGLFTSCETCYNDRFGAEMIGRPISEVVTLLGTPKKISEAAGVKQYTWSVDKSYSQERYVPGEWDEWKDKKGHYHSTYNPPHYETDHYTLYSRLTFMVSGGRITNYTSDYAGEGMCNYFVPRSYQQRYEAEDEAAKSAGYQQHRNLR
ncbi:MAG: hypothetical protein ACI4OX_08850 [Akkermansia sp.]